MTEWAIRHPKRGKAHRPWDGIETETACGKWARDMARVPLDQVPAAERCRICWKDET